MGAATVSGRGTLHLRGLIRTLGRRSSFRGHADSNDGPDRQYIPLTEVVLRRTRDRAGTPACGNLCDVALLALQPRTAENLAAR